MLKEFKDFISKGNMLDLAIGIVIGAAFGKLTDAFMGNLINPLVGMITGGTDFSNKFLVLKDGGKVPGPYDSLKAATDAGANTLQYGAFVSAIVSFLITMAVMFMVVKVYNKMKAAPPEEVPATPANEVLLAEIRDLLKK
jgi:large conductance mechanosensitive channel